MTRKYQLSIVEEACHPNSTCVDSLRLENCGSMAYDTSLARCVSHENFTQKSLFRLASLPKATREALERESWKPGRLAFQDGLQGGERRSAVHIDTATSAVPVNEEDRNRLPNVQLCQREKGRL